MSAALRKPATLRDTAEADALREENERLRLALHRIATVAGGMVESAKSNSSAAGFSHLRHLALEELERQ